MRSRGYKPADSRRFQKCIDEKTQLATERSALDGSDNGEKDLAYRASVLLEHAPQCDELRSQRGILLDIDIGQLHARARLFWIQSD